jgi:membrane-associated protein
MPFEGLDELTFPIKKNKLRKYQLPIRLYSTSRQSPFVLIFDYGIWIYAILFNNICWTGLVVMPFLPGDSLLFAAGTFVQEFITTLDKLD